jgi:hypothetical protein
MEIKEEITCGHEPLVKWKAFRLGKLNLVICEDCYNQIVGMVLNDILNKLKK